MPFWWLTSLLYRELLKIDDPVKNWALGLSFASVLLFGAGYALPVVRLRFRAASTFVLDNSENFSYIAVLGLAIPAIAIALFCAKYLASQAYGSTNGLPLAAQAVFYPYLFFGLMFLGVARDSQKSRRRILTVCALMVFPRIIVTLHYGRFFAAQAIVPIVFLAVARNWMRLTKRYLIALCLLAIAIIFVPAYTRGDSVAGKENIVKFFASGSNLQLFQDNADLNLDGRCSLLVVSMTAKLVPYHWLGVCTIDYEGLRGVPATLERILTVNQVGSASETGAGTGSNYMLELYLSGGLTCLLIGSMAFGYCCKLLIASLANRSLFNGIWAMCLSRALLAPRGNLGYVFELVPMYVLITLLTACFACAVCALTSSRRKLQALPIR